MANSPTALHCAEVRHSGPVLSEPVRKEIWLLLGFEWTVVVVLSFSYHRVVRVLRVLHSQ